MLSVGLETLPRQPAWLVQAFWLEKIVVVTMFSFEYPLRLAVAPKKQAFVLSLSGLVDLPPSRRSS